MLSEPSGTTTAASQANQMMNQALLAMGRQASGEEPESMEETFFCGVCLCNKRKSHGYRLSTCGHYFCPECLRGYLKSQINVRQTCPRCFVTDEKKGTVCNSEIVESDIKATVTPATWAKYIRFRNKNSNDNYVDCPRCKFQQLGDPRQPWIVCAADSCNHEFCFVHQNQHPKNVTCAQFEAKQRKEHKLNHAWKAANTRACPKCEAPTEKNEGCNHMTCVKCGTGWCWLCGAEIGNEPVPQHYKDEGKCKGRQFTQAPTIQMYQWEAIFCVLLPMFFLLLFSPIAFVMICVVLILTPCLIVFSFAMPDNDAGSNCIATIAQVLMLGPLLLVTLPMWLPCFVYYHCVIKNRELELDGPGEVNDQAPLIPAGGSEDNV